MGKAHLQTRGRRNKILGKCAIAQKKLYEKSQLESLVQRYPNDYGYRYELGINFLKNEDYDNCSLIST